MGINDPILQRGWRGGGQVSRFFQKSEHYKSENFPWPWWETHFKINPNQSTELWKDLSFRFMGKRFQMSSQVQFLSC